MTPSALTSALLRGLQNKSSGDFASSNSPAFELSGHKVPASLNGLCLAVTEHLEHGGQIYGLESHCQAFHIHANVTQTFWKLNQLVHSPGAKWLLLANWVNQRSSRPETCGEIRSIRTILQPHLDCLDQALIHEASGLFDRFLGTYGNDAWPPVDNGQPPQLRRQNLPVDTDWN
jgi:hypothetical protein